MTAVMQGDRGTGIALLTCWWARSLQLLATRIDSPFLSRIDMALPLHLTTVWPLWSLMLKSSPDRLMTPSLMARTVGSDRAISGYGPRGGLKGARLIAAGVEACSQEGILVDVV